MFDPSTLTLGQVSSAIRDFAVVGFLFTIAWKSRGVYGDIQAIVGEVQTIIKRLKRFMVRMERNSKEANMKLDLLLGNHLKHIEADLAKVAGRTVEEKETKQV